MGSVCNLEKIRLATPNDIPALVQLAEQEYNEIIQDNHFSATLCERYIITMLQDINAVILVWTNVNNQVFGYMAGMLDAINLSTYVTAVTHHWYVNKKNATARYGLKLIAEFESWAKHKGAINIMIGTTMKPNNMKYYNRTFGKMGYDTNIIYYKKELN
jgi:hypothetical protein